MNGEESPRLIDLGRSIESPIGRGLFKLVELPLGKMFSLAEVNRLYAESLAVDGARNYFASIQRVLNVEYELDDGRVPPSGTSWRGRTGACSPSSDPAPSTTRRPPSTTHAGSAP